MFIDALAFSVTERLQELHEFISVTVDVAYEVVHAVLLV
jgi:hypothetical protein